MPPSQLKKLKASLRAEGVGGPQLSKKQKRKNNANGTASETRAQRNSALQRIREQFNPFEVKEPSRGREKFEVTRNASNGAKAAKRVKGRPGVTKGLGEEVRRKTLLKDIQRRNKVGGIRDRRFGEDDPTMAPEDKMLERFTAEKQRRLKNDSLFNLEDEEQQDHLTHLGQSLSFDVSTAADDLDASDLGLSDEEEEARKGRGSQKRRRSSESDSDGRSASEDQPEGEPERKKSKAEVMKEVMAKSKFHKYERQQAKEEDEDVREELDKELPGLLALLRGDGPGGQKPPGATQDSSMNPDRAALIQGVDHSSPNKNYDQRLREMVLDKRSMPTERTKTEQEKAEQEATRLRELEEGRMQRMRGEVESSDEDEPRRPVNNDGPRNLDENDGNAVDLFGLGSGIPIKSQDQAAAVEDEDDFVIDEDLVASGSDISVSGSDDASGNDDSDNDLQADHDDDTEFIQHLLPADRSNKPESGTIPPSEQFEGVGRSLAYTYPCPQNHEELLQILEEVPVNDVPTVVQRIRALYHPKLHSDNKAKMAVFSTVLVDHLVHLANMSPHPSFAILETLIRHIHSLAKTNPEDVSRAFRSCLKYFQDIRPLAPSGGDLVLLAAIGTIFPTSDHFHRVATPANLTMARYLCQKMPTSLSELVTGSWIQTVCLQYQRFSKRYIPEVINYALNAICNLAPIKPNLPTECFPYHELSSALRIQGASTNVPRPLQFRDREPQSSIADEEGLKATLLETQLTLLRVQAEMWAGKPAFHEAFQPALQLVQQVDGQACRAKLSAGISTQVAVTAELLQRLLRQSLASRRPLALHHHRPLAIKSSIPKFEESYDLNKHYDPNRDRADLAKLKAEHKRERKGAMRELRKDANFIARESLKEKKERDQEYDKKYKRLVAEIQGEEGREANEYERVKRMRKQKR
ncbi:MAG: nucleolar complex protein 14 [Sclerophora amabilis]|nr:MAG: nucleolar complex protein 14 [Sclerophora amabilis]